VPYLLLSAVCCTTIAILAGARRARATSLA
jgi:hypothetical protein